MRVSRESNVSNVTLYDILTDYREHFSGRLCTVKTNYLGASELQIYFEERSLFHLLGLHYVTTGYNATKAIREIDRGELTMSNIKRHREFNNIKYRLLGLPSIYYMLIHPRAKICVVKKDMFRNNMNLDLIFWDNLDRDKVIILGLKKDVSSGIYYPTTLLRKSRKVVEEIRHTVITSIVWN